MRRTQRCVSAVYWRMLSPVALNRPHVSLNTIHAITQGWFQSRCTNSSSSRSYCARVSGRGSPQKHTMSAHASTPSLSIQ